MRISDWSSDVCSSDLLAEPSAKAQGLAGMTSPPKSGNVHPRVREAFHVQVGDGPESKRTGRNTRVPPASNPAALRGRPLNADDLVTRPPPEPAAVGRH